MKKLCIAPFTEETYPLIEYLKNIYVIEALAAPMGIGIEGEDVSVLRNTNPIGFCFTNSLEKAICRSEVVIIPDISKAQKSLRAYAWEALQLSSQNGKEVLCFLELSDLEIETIKQISLENGGRLDLLSEPEDYDVNFTEALRLNQINIPVFYISESIPGCDGYDVFLKLADGLRNSGKNVLAISENCYNTILGFDFIKIGAKLEIRDQIFRFNMLVYNLLQQKKPDVILILNPQPMFKYDEANPFDCGGTAFIASQAVVGDGCIFCSHAKAFPVETWEAINDVIYSKFGYPVIGVHVSNRMIDITGGADLTTICIPTQEVSSEVELRNKNSTLPFCQLLEKTDFDKFNKELYKIYFNLPYGVI